MCQLCNGTNRTNEYFSEDAASCLNCPSLQQRSGTFFGFIGLGLGCVALVFAGLYKMQPPEFWRTSA